MQKLKVNDSVVIIAGRDRGKTGKVLKIFHKANRVLVDGVNIVKKTVRPTQENPAGGIMSKEATIHRSNVMVAHPKTNAPTRVRIEKKEGKSIRVFAKDGAALQAAKE